MDQLGAIARAWLVRLHSGESTQSDLGELSRWRAEKGSHERAFREAAAMWQALGPALELEDDEPIEKPSTRLVPAALPARPMSRRLFLGGACAVMVGAVIGGTLLVHPDEAGATIVETGKGETRKVMLGAGLTVTLNTDTRLAYWSDAREPRMLLDRGEAMVVAALAPGRNVRASSADCEVVAQRAHFLLRRDGDVTRVSCLDGGVSILRDGRSFTLGEKRVVTLGGEEVRPVETAATVEAEGAWQRGLFLFKDRPAGEVVAEINRYRSGHVFLPAAQSSVRISGVLSVDRADLAVDHVARMLGMKVVRIPGGLVFLRS